MGELDIRKDYGDDGRGKQLTRVIGVAWAMAYTECVLFDRTSRMSLAPGALSVFDMLAERRILDAQQQGVFDRLPGAGRPLVFEDETLVAPEQRMANRILRNAGFTPPEITLRREIAELRERLKTLEGESSVAPRRELRKLVLRLAETKRG